MRVERTCARRRVTARSSAVGICVSLALLGSLARSQDANLCDVPGEAPDLIVGDITSRVRWGNADGITAFSFGVGNCNMGSCRANWTMSTPEHPVIGQNLFRLENGRFEQIGQSWLFHEFFALSGSLCATDCVPSDGAHLGVHCSNPDVPNYLGLQSRLGPKFEVDASTGVFPFPATDLAATGGPTYKRVQVHDSDLDPALNPGAQYFVELQIVSRDDAAAAHQHNNASYRPVLVSDSNGVFDVSMTGTTVREQAAIEAWRASDPTVLLTDVVVPGEGRLILGAKVTADPAGWHYEYAIQNLNSQRSIGGISVPLPAGAVLTNAGFHDVDYHSGEPFSLSDWIATASAGAVVFETESYEQNPNANALRWGTLYNVRFDCDVPPSTGDVTLHFFRPGTPAVVSATTLAPRACDTDGVCDPGETCGNCPADCTNQGGGPGCCGNGLCEPGESPCTCATDCGQVAAVESTCGNQIDDDCDGSVDCADADCCRAAACSSEDADGDSRSVLCDCDDSNPQVWSAPGEARDLSLIPMGNTASVLWLPPVDAGGSAVTYDLIRSTRSDDFGDTADCVFLPDPSSPASMDGLNPPAGGQLFYLVRAKNACPGASGSLGTTSNGQPRQGRSCP